MSIVNRYAQNIRVAARRAFTWFKGFGKRVGWWKLSALGGVLLGVFGGIAIAGGGTPPPAQVEQAPRAVELRSVAELSGDSSPLPLVGVVKSQAEAEVRTESSGQIVRLYRELGDSVAAGAIIAEMENSRERAAVLQAEGSVDAATAQVQKLTRGVRDEQRSILETNLGSAQSSLTSARTGAVNALLSAYATMDESIRRKADQMFSNPDTTSPSFNVIVADSQLTIDMTSGRSRLNAMLEREAALSSTLSATDDLKQELDRTESEVREAKNFFDKLTAALNKAVPSQSVSEATIATYKTDANAARVSINATLSALASARTTLTAQEAALEVAEKNLEQGVVGGQAEDVAAAEAALKQSQGSLAAARANLEKTIVRAPISGTINNLSIERGDFVSSFTPVLTIANNNALEIVSYITERDARELSVGTPARIEERFDGVITRIAPALDPATKKIEVRIGLTGDSTLVNGEAVTVSLSRAAAQTTSTGRLVIPLSSLKVGTEANVVFTVDEGGMLVAHPVTLGELLGDRVVIEDGLTPDMRIVLDARGLRAGEAVTLK